MSEFLVDADAFIHSRTLSLLQVARTLVPPIRMGEYVARHELVDLQTEIDGLVQAGQLVVCKVMQQTQEFVVYRDLQRAGIDRGEREAIAWALSRAPEIVFVSCDKKALKTAQARGLQIADLLDFAMLMVYEGVADKELVCSKLRVWNDNNQGRGCPKGFRDLESAWAEREIKHRQSG